MLLPANVPAFPDPTAAPTLQQRWPGVRRLLSVSYVWIPAALVAFFVLLVVPAHAPLGSDQAVAMAVCAAGVAAPAVIALIWLRVAGLRNWRYWGMAVVGTGGQLLAGLTLGLGVLAPESGGLLPNGSVAAAAVLSMAAWLCTVKAKQWLIEPLAVELGDLDLDLVLFRDNLRSFSYGRAVEVAVRGPAIVIRSQQTGFATRGQATRQRLVTIPFQDIRSVRPWAAKPDKPWFVDLDGYGWYPPGSESVVVRSAHPTRDTVIPVRDARIAAEVLDRRLRRFHSVSR